MSTKIIIILKGVFYLKKAWIGLSLLVLLTVIVGCSDNTQKSNTSNESSSEKKEKTVTLTLAHAFNESHPGHQTLVEMAGAAEERSDGTMKINIVSGGALGTEKDYMNQLQTGALDMVYIAGVSMFEGLDKRLGIEDVPFLFESKEKAYQAVDGAYGDKIAEIVGEYDIHILAYWDAGFRHFTNNVRPIESPEDLEGIKFRSSPIELRLKMFEELGASAIPIDFNELFIALQQGTVNGQENPLSLISDSKFYEVQKYLSLSGHILNASQVSISSKTWEKLSETQQQLLQDLTIEYRQVARDKMKEQEDNFVAELQEQGMEVNEVDSKAFQEAMKNVEALYIESNGDELIKLARQ